MPLFPLFADLRGREVLVVGGGEVALRKVEALLHAGARVRVHALALQPTLAQWCGEGRIERVEGEFDPAWLDAAWLVVVATDDAGFNARVAAEAERRHRFANVVDDARLSGFQVPAVVDRDPLLVAISSGGAAPMLARRLREQLETQFDDSLGEFAGLFAQHRDAIRQRLPDLAQRRRWFDRVIDGPIQSLLRSGQRDAAARAFEEALQLADVSVIGSVSLVGTGSGKPGELTLDALRAMNQADVVVHGAGVSSEVLALARKDATRLPAPEDREACIALVAVHACRGQRVAWLEPGDRFRAQSDDRLRTRFIELDIVCETIAGIA